MTIRSDFRQLATDSVYYLLSRRCGLDPMELLEEEERSRVKGVIINKFRGDVSILAPGIRMLEECGGLPGVGVGRYLLSP